LLSRPALAVLGRVQRRESPEIRKNRRCRGPAETRVKPPRDGNPIRKPPFNGQNEKPSERPVGGGERPRPGLCPTEGPSGGRGPAWFSCPAHWGVFSFLLTAGGVVGTRKWGEEKELPSSRNGFPGLQASFPATVRPTPAERAFPPNRVSPSGPRNLGSGSRFCPRPFTARTSPRHAGEIRAGGPLEGTIFHAFRRGRGCPQMVLASVPNSRRGRPRALE